MQEDVRSQDNARQCIASGIVAFRRTSTEDLATCFYVTRHSNGTFTFNNVANGLEKSGTPCMKLGCTMELRSCRVCDASVMLVLPTSLRHRPSISRSISGDSPQIW